MASTGDGEGRPDAETRSQATVVEGSSRREPRVAETPLGKGTLIVQHMLGWNPKLGTENLAERVVDTVLAGIANPR